MKWISTKCQDRGKRILLEGLLAQEDIKKMTDAAKTVAVMSHLIELDHSLWLARGRRTWRFLLEVLVTLQLAAERFIIGVGRQQE